MNVCCIWDLVSVRRPPSDVTRYGSLPGQVLLELDTLQKSLVSEFCTRVHPNTPYDVPRPSLSLDGVNPGQVSDSFPVLVFFQHKLFSNYHTYNFTKEL